MSREISLMSLVLNWPSYTRSLDEENFGGTTQTFIWLPYYSAIQKKTLCQEALEYENSKKMDIFLVAVVSSSSPCKPWWIDDFYTGGVVVRARDST